MTPASKRGPRGSDPRRGPAPLPGEERTRLERSRRRAAAKLHHPDLGGDPDAFIESMRQVEDPMPVVGRASTLARASRTVRRRGRDAVRGLRQHLPRSFPGSRRYGRL